MRNREELIKDLYKLPPAQKKHLSFIKLFILKIQYNYIVKKDISRRFAISKIF
jgi:hypothetical protein